MIVYTGALAHRATKSSACARYSSSIIVKGARSPERLLDEVTLFLHQVEAELPPDRQRMLRQARDREAAFEGRKILIAEDDVRNIFALDSVLEPKGAKVDDRAQRPRGARAARAQRRDIDLVLMDIMMPEMDGLAAMRAHPQARPDASPSCRSSRSPPRRCTTIRSAASTPAPTTTSRSRSTWRMLLSLIRVWMPK